MSFKTVAGIPRPMPLAAPVIARFLKFLYRSVEGAPGGAGLLAGLLACLLHPDDPRPEGRRAHKRHGRPGPPHYSYSPAPLGTRLIISSASSCGLSTLKSVSRLDSPAVSIWMLPTPNKRCVIR